MNSELNEEIKNYIDKSLEQKLGKYLKIYSREDLLTRSEFLEALKLIDRRFDAVDKRFEAVDKRFKELIDTMNNRFKEADKRIEELIDTMNNRFKEADKRFEMQNIAIQENARELKILTLSISRIETKEGILFEKAVLDLLKDTLKLENISSEKIRKEYLSDPEGDLFFPGYSTDIDILLENNNTYLIEVKSTASSQDIAHFLQNAKLFEKSKGKKPTQLILVTLRITQETYKLAESQKIRIIAGEIF